MKTRLVVLLCMVVLVCISLFGCSGCSSRAPSEPSADVTTETPSSTVDQPDTTSEPQHICKFDKKVTDAKYLKSEKNCMSAAIYYYSCECGALGSETFEHGVYGETHIPNADDGDCTTEIRCTLCNMVITPACASHTPADDDGDCTTAVKCVICTKNAIDAHASHTAEPQHADDCTKDRKCVNCETVVMQGNTTHTAEPQHADDCTKDRKCVNCATVVMQGNTAHTAEPQHTDDCTKSRKCVNCEMVVMQGNTAHTAEPAHTDDCTKDRKCVNCETVVMQGNTTHTAEPAHTDDCTKDRKCVNCEKVAIAGNASHTAGTDDGSCETPVKCANCETVTTNAKTHKFDKESTAQYSAATCQTKAKNYYSCSNSGCNVVSNDPEDTYETGAVANHNYIRELIKADRLAEGYTCEADAKYYKTCEWCDSFSSTQKFTATEALTDHVYDHQIESSATYKGEDADPEGNYYYYYSCVCGATSEGDTDTYYSVLKNHTHAYDQNVVNSRYLKGARTCTEYAKYYKSCECGKSSKTGSAGEVGYNEYFEDIAGGKSAHIPEAEDYNCETALVCQNCPHVFVEAKTHIPEGYHTDDCTKDRMCTNADCNHKVSDGYEAHIAEAAHADDCTKDRKCIHCEAVVYEGRDSHESRADDGDCTTDIVCQHCTSVVTEGYDDHIGGTATCQEQAECERCRKKYGELDTDNHAYDQAIPDDEYVKSETETEREYYYSCKCGANEENDEHTFTVIIDNSEDDYKDDLDDWGNNAN